MSSSPRKRLNEARRLSNEYSSNFGLSDDEEGEGGNIDQSYSIFWKSAFTHLNGQRRREIISNMWKMPITAHHLAARLIQSVYRGYLLRILLKKENWWENVERHRHEHMRLAKSQRIEGREKEEVISFRERLSHLVEIKGDDYIAASLIQAMARMFFARKRMEWMKHRIYHIAAMEIQYIFRASKRYREEKMRRRYSENELCAIDTIQAAWKRYRNRRIYMSLRDTLNFRNAGDPKELLKSLSPGDSHLCDGATRIFVRLRLGGESFPPRIYFKIFTKSAVCDVNAFAPRNYAVERVSSISMDEEDEDEDDRTRVVRVGRKQFHLHTSRRENESWYRRYENNGWQPLLVSDDTTSSSSSYRPLESKSFRVLKSRREIEGLRKRKRRDWMTKLYMSGGRTKKDTKTNTNEDEEDDEELLKWADRLNFDKYKEDWMELGTTTT
jgi:hypothetical protein